MIKTLMKVQNQYTCDIRRYVFNITSDTFSHTWENNGKDGDRWINDIMCEKSKKASQFSAQWTQIQPTKLSYLHPKRRCI